MTTETKRRIQFYREALPSMKKRTFAALMLLLIAMIVAVVATYAWVTLSYSPEVARITTTLSSNGSLEIALSKPDASQPDETDIDESVPYNNSVAESNLRWGNLINISDPSYGIDDLVLRPAQLNTASLSTSPLWGAVYGSDGRITQLNTKYTYAKWDGTEFLASTEHGVRAIASYITATSDASAREYDELYQNLVNAHTAVNEYYKNNVATKDNIGSLGSVMSTYLQSKINQEGYGTDSNASANIALTTAQVTSVRNMYQSVYNAMDKEIEALLVLADLQQYIYAKEHDLTFTPMTWERLQNGQNKYDSAGTQHKKTPTTPDEAVSIKGLKTFITNRNYAVSDIATLNALVDKSNSGTTVYSNELDSAVSHLCAPGSALIDGKSMDQWMSGSKTDLLSLTSGDHLATLGAGVLKVYEQMAIDANYRLPNSTSTNSNAAAISAKAKYIITISINMTGHICTNASGNSYFMDDMSAIPSEINAGDKIAEDTYGMAVDFWVRTNSEGTYLMLEGATTTDTDGTILSYDGVNRVWGSTGNMALTTDSTTQGGGSCYIYYADTPEDANRSLELLRSLKVAFVAPDGTLLATAIMDTDHPWPVNGRYTVPLIIEQREENAFTKTDEFGEALTLYGIRYMTLDESYMITAIIYMDGATLENTHVLSSNEIDGQLNLQFSSSERLTTVGDNRLLTAERYVTATVSRTSMDYDTATSDADLTTTVTANVSGIDPTSVKAFFVRAVNSTQGTRQSEISFTKQSSGVWTADYVFPAPGTYYLRYIRMDGVDYALSDPPMVEVTGFALTNVRWGEAGNTHTVYSTDSSYTERVYVEFESTDVSRMPSTVQARFIRDDGNAVSIDTRYNAASRCWEGAGSFSASGTYTLSYLVLDGNYYDMSRFAKTLTLYLGMTARVFNNNSTLVDEFDAEHMNEVHIKDVQVRIMDNAGNPLEGLTGTRLYYSLGGSSTNGVDADLEWNEGTGYYEGQLQLVRMGRYTFRSLQVGSNILSRVTEYPIYVIASPDAPEYNTASQSAYNTEVQFIPLKTNATVGPIRIDNTAACMVSAVVYNSESGEYAAVPFTTNTTAPNGMYYVNSDGGYWMINLPTYETASGKTDIRNGTWSVVAINVAECLDADANYHDEDNPIVWLGTSAEANAYAAEHSITADQRINFSRLSTVVSNKVVVTMTPGSTELGSASTPFMTAYEVKDLGMTVAVRDGANRAIPADRLSDVVLYVSYSANTDLSYGYEVSTAANKSYPIHMVYSESGRCWIPDAATSNYVWQYVGEYTVSTVDGLSVTVEGTTMNFAPGENGVPEKYTITSAAPSADNLTVSAMTQSQTVYGKTGDNVTGAFLAAYTPALSVTMDLSPKDANGYQYAILPGIGISLNLNYLDGTNAPNGAYSWSGTTGYEYVTFNLSSTDGLTYRTSGSSPLLAGSYALNATVSWDGGSSPLSQLKYTGSNTKVGNLSNIAVYSVQPTLTITGISKTGAVTFNANGGGSKTSDANPKTGTNAFGDDYAVAYMEYAVSTKAGTKEGIFSSDSNSDYSGDYADYTAPTVTITASDVGTVTATMTLNDETGTSTNTSFSASDASKTIAIGRIVTGTDSWWSYVYTYSYPTETAYILGTKTINSVTSSINATTVTRTLTKPIIISQTTQEAPKLSYTFTDTDVVVRNDTASIGISSGSDVPSMSSVRVTLTPNDGYYNPRMTKPTGVSNWMIVEESETRAVYTFNMSFIDTSFTASSTKYPAVTFNGTSAVAVTVRTDHGISSGTGVKPGTTVTVTATIGNQIENSLPKIAVPSEWTKSEGDYTSTYTFTMPNAAVAIPAPTHTVNPTVDWDSGHASLEFSLTDETANKNVLNGGTVVPGHTMTVTLTAKGGINPSLSNPQNATPYGSTSSSFVRQYRFTMPTSNITLNGSCQEYPKVYFGNDFTTVTSFQSDYAQITLGTATALGVRPGNKVTITLQTVDGYQLPRMTKPEAVTDGWTVDEETAYTATYSFTMPSVAVNAAEKIAVTGNTVTYNVNGSGGTVNPASATFAGTALTLPTPSRSGYSFIGWFSAESGGTKIDSPYTPTANITLYAHWNNTVTYNANGGSVSTASETKAEGSAFTLPTPSRTGYTFNGWYTEASGGSKVGDAGKSYTPAGNVTLYAQWTINTYTITTKNGGGDKSGSCTLYYKNPNDSSYKSVSVKFGSQNNLPTIQLPTIQVQHGGSVYYDNTSNFSSASYDGSNWSSGQRNAKTVTSSPTVEFKASSSSCIASGTLITLADGTQKPIEDISPNDNILAWDFFTGTAVEKNISILVFHGNRQSLVKELHFSDGTVLRLIEEHGVFDYDLNRFVYIMPDNYQEYLGHHFAKINPDRTVELVTLDTVELVEEYTGVWSISSAVTSNAVAEGMLTVAPPEAFYNWVTMSGKMKYDTEEFAKDIETYGLYTYDVFKDYVSEKQFVDWNGAYLKIPVEKGLFTFDFILELIVLYKQYMP